MHLDCCRAFFPFTDSFDSWPLPISEGTADAVNITSDALFGGALDCTAALDANITLPALPYSSKGPFSHQPLGASLHQCRRQLQLHLQSSGQYWSLRQCD